MKPILQVFPQYGKKTEFHWQILAVMPFDKIGESPILAKGTAWDVEQATKDASAAFINVIKTKR